MRLREVLFILVILVGGVVVYFLYISDNGNVNDNSNSNSAVINVKNEPVEMKEVVSAENGKKEYTYIEPTTGKKGDIYFLGQPESTITLEVYAKDNRIMYRPSLLLTKQFPSYVRLQWHPFPMIALYPESEYFNLAIQCAGDQDYFWEFMDYLYTAGEQVSSKQDFAALDVTSVGMSQNKYATCIESEQYAGLIEQLLNEARESGVDGSPYIFVNNEFVGGADRTAMSLAVTNALRASVVNDWVHYIVDDNVSIYFPSNYSIREGVNDQADYYFEIVHKTSDVVVQARIYKSNNAYTERNDQLEEEFVASSIDMPPIYTSVSGEEISWKSEVLTAQNKNIPNLYRLIGSDFRIGDVDGNVLDISVWYFIDFSAPDTEEARELINLLGVGYADNH